MSCMLPKEQVDRLIKEYGSPLYVFHSEEFEKNYSDLLQAIRCRYSKYNIAYSFKTNYTPRILQIVKNNGGLAEVVSNMEYELAKRLGYKNESIVYNGPVKGNGLFEHIANGGVANLDSLDELKTVLDYAQNHTNTYFKIAFRVNIDIGQGFISRFGIDAYEERQKCELDDAFDLCNDCSNVKVVGLHCHIGRCRSLAAWKNRVRIMFALVDRYFNEVPEFIDFGSGMNSVMEPELAQQFGGDIPSFSEYAEIIADAMNKKYGHLPVKDRPWLYTEPGTTLISGCISMLGSVQSIKRVKEKYYATFDCCGGNLGDIAHLKNLPISVYHCGKETRPLVDACFVGYTCLEHDHIYEGYNGPLAVGDLVQFRNIGSYSNVFKPPFILPNCAMVQLNKNGSTDLIKRVETMDDLFQTYVF